MQEVNSLEMLPKALSNSSQMKNDNCDVAVDLSNRIQSQASPS